VKAELLKEINRQFEVIDDDSYVIQPFERHASNLQLSQDEVSLFAAFFRRAEENVLGRALVELTIVLAATRSNAPQVLRDAASVYKVDTDAIAAKVRQEFAAKDKARGAKKASTKAAATKLKKTA